MIKNKIKNMKKTNKAGSNKSKRMSEEDDIRSIGTVLGVALGVILVVVGLANITKIYTGVQNGRSEAELRDEINSLTEESEKLKGIDGKLTEFTIIEGKLADAEAELYKVKSGFYTAPKKQAWADNAALLISGIAIIAVAIVVMRYGS